MKVGMFISGLIILIITFLVMFNFRELESNILQTHQICESSIGSIGKFVSGSVTEECQNNKYLFFIVNYGFLGYIFGGLLILLSLIISKRKSEKEESKERKQFCIKCGRELYDYEKYCPSCGKEKKE